MTSTFNQTVQQDLSSPSFLSQLAGYLGGEAAPGIAQQGLTGAQAQAQAGVMPAALQEGIAQQTQTAGYSLANALLGEQSAQLGQQGLASQIGTAAQQQAIEQQQYPLQQEQIGLQQQALGSTVGTAQQQQAIEQQQYPLQQQQIGLQEQGTALQLGNLAYQQPIAQEKQYGGAAATGALNSQGNKQGMASLAQQYGYQGSQLNIQGQNEYIQSQLAQLGQQSELAGYGGQQAQYGYQGQQLGVQQQLAGLGQQSEEVGYAGQQAQYANQYQQLALAAQQAGIPVQQAISQLQYGIGQQGIQADPTSLMAQAANAQSNQAGGYSTVVSQGSAAGAAMSNAAARMGLGANFAASGQPVTVGSGNKAA